MPKPPPTLKKRSGFLAMNKAPKWVTPGFILQYAPTTGKPSTVGYTVSKKVGGAVVRNTVKRRLRAVAAGALKGEAATIVLIGRPGADKIAFDQLQRDLTWALKRVKQKALPS